MRFRKTNPGDLPQLKSLWALGFGDTEQGDRGVFRHFLPPPPRLCAEEREGQRPPPRALGAGGWLRGKLPHGLSFMP